MSKIAFLFAGQGSQTPGMGQDFYRNSDVFRQVMDSCGKLSDLDVCSLSFSGPAAKLNETAVAQPCLAAVELGLVRMLSSAGIRPSVVAGLSLGEYAALTCAGAIREEDLVSSAARRGRLMQEALPAGTGSMMAVLSNRLEDIRLACQAAGKQNEICEIANFNSPSQYVLSGTARGLSIAGKHLEELGIRRCLPLKVSGPFHSPLLKTASLELDEILKEYPLQAPDIPVVFNTTACSETCRDGNRVRELLVRQLYSPVLFDQSLDTMLQAGVDTFIEIGPGHVLSRLVQKKNRDVRVFGLETMEDYERIRKELHV